MYRGSTVGQLKTESAITLHFNINWTIMNKMGTVCSNIFTNGALTILSEHSFLTTYIGSEEREANRTKCFSYHTRYKENTIDWSNHDATLRGLRSKKGSPWKLKLDGTKRQTITAILQCILWNSLNRAITIVELKRHNDRKGWKLTSQYWTWTQDDHLESGW